jgi:hypothetical protein
VNGYRVCPECAAFDDAGAEVCEECGAALTEAERFRRLHPDCPDRRGLEGLPLFTPGGGTDG